MLFRSLSELKGKKETSAVGSAVGAWCFYLQRAVDLEPWPRDRWGYPPLYERGHRLRGCVNV